MIILKSSASVRNEENQTFIRLGQSTYRIQLSLCEEDVQTGYTHGDDFMAIS